MSNTVPSPAEIIESFPKVPAKIVGQLEYSTLKALRQTMKTNAASVPTIYGGGIHGHLGMVLQPNVYNNIVPPINAQVNAWIDPVTPALVPAYPPQASATVMEETRERHKETIRCFRLYHNVNKALMTQLLQAVDNVYIRALKNQHTGFSQCHIRDVLHYLFTHYGKVTPQALMENDTTFRQDWDPTTPFELLIDQIESAQEFALDGFQPYTTAQILTNAYTLVHKTGAFNDDCKKWQQKPDHEKTWDNFKAHFLQAQEDNRLQRTAQQSGYFSMLLNQQVHKQCIPILEAANSLTEANIRRDEEMSLMSNSHAAFSAQQQKLQEIIAALTKEVADLKAASSTTTKKRQPPTDRGGYCWSHGFLVHPNHTSKTCRNKKPGHKDEATRSNTMGGSQTGNPQE